MTPETLQAAYDDAMKRLKGSMLGPQLAAPIEAYVAYVTDRDLEMAMCLEKAKVDIGDVLADIDRALDTKLEQR